MSLAIIPTNCLNKNTFMHVKSLLTAKQTVILYGLASENKKK